MKKIILFIAVALTSLMNAQTTPVLLHGNESVSHFKVYIVADGFTSSQMSTFNTHADGIADLFTDTLLPFSTSDTKYCIYRVNTTSSVSGYSIQGGTTKDTYWDLFTNNQGMSHYYGIPSASRDKIEDWYENDSKGFRTYVIFVSNNTNYAGYGDIPSYGSNLNSTVSCMVTTIDPTYRDFLVSHEFGHSFADLDDEYVDPVYAATTEGSTYIATHMNRDNIKDSNPNTWTEGGRYVATGKWRYGDGLMRSATWAYHTGNKNIVQTRINAAAVVKKCSKPSGILTDDAFGQKNGSGEWHYVIKSGNVYGKYWRSNRHTCSSYGSMTTLQSFQYYSERTAKVNDSNYYQINDYLDWD